MNHLKLNCIFCLSEFFFQTHGDGEHVVPQNIFGFWKIYDVCPKCVTIFGNSVDHLALKNIEVLNLLDRLSLKDTTPYYENIPFVGLDSKSRIPLKMVFRKGSLRVKILKSPSLIRCDETQLETVAKPELRTLLAAKIREDEFEAEFQKMLSAYRKLPMGGTYHSPTLGYSIQKGQVVSREVDHPSLPPISRLIAKIVVCCAHYLIPFDQQNLLIDLNPFVEHAINGTELPEYKLLRLMSSDDAPFRFHSLAVSTHGHELHVDVFLFGVMCWRAILTTSDLPPKK